MDFLCKAILYISSKQIINGKSQKHINKSTILKLGRIKKNNYISSYFDHNAVSSIASKIRPQIFQSFLSHQDICFELHWQLPKISSSKRTTSACSLHLHRTGFKFWYLKAWQAWKILHSCSQESLRDVALSQKHKPLLPLGISQQPVMHPPTISHLYWMGLELMVGNAQMLTRRDNQTIPHHW